MTNKGVAKKATDAMDSGKPVPSSLRFTMMLLAVCLVYTGIKFGEPIYEFLEQLRLSKQFIAVLESVRSAISQNPQTMAWLIKASVISLYLLPLFTVGCLLITRQNKYLKISAIPLLSFSVGFLLKFLFGWRI